MGLPLEAVDISTCTFRRVHKDPPLMPGLFALFDTHGLPLSFALDMCLERGTLPDWVALVRDARKAGWGPRKILATVTEAIRDVYPPKDKPAVLARFAELVGVLYGSDAAPDSLLAEYV